MYCDDNKVFSTPTISTTLINFINQNIIDQIVMKTK